MDLIAKIEGSAETEEIAGRKMIPASRIHGISRYGSKFEKIPLKGFFHFNVVQSSGAK